MLPQIVINESKYGFGIFLSAFKTAVDDTYACAFMTNAEVFKLDAVSRSTPLVGQPVSVEDSTGNREGIIIKCLSNNELVVRFLDGVESVVSANDVKPTSQPSTPSSK